MLNYEILEKLTRTIGVSGEEDDVRSVILSEIEPYADEIHISPLGNILAFKKGEKRPEKKLMLCAHMDEVGFFITNITVNGLLAKDLQTTVTTFTAGIQLQLLMKQGLTEKQAMAQLMPVRFDKHVLFNPHINYGYYLSPSFMPMMLLIFTIMATIFVIGTELKNGTAREWYDTAGGSVFAAYAGKILPITVIMFLMSELMLLVIFKVVGVPLNGSLTVITISNLLFILSYQSLGAMIVTVLSNLRLSLSIGGGYSVLAFTFSGLTFPIMAMSKPMQWFCCIFPFTFYTDIMVDQALRGAPAIYSLPDMGIIALFIILPLLCLPRLRTICTNKKYWGRL